ncbi:HIT zinc finger and PAPA-1-like domain-containing protein [Actinidia rufa]|uniref:HIT zinc finger and PAPA-1-like domain-containing protein n=1 Tax=Actinidia rufa TaxID=165716 RepID=A0A7J0GT69_9ERIC|nr:HIT zinc finger and PAPA-1-like domain-containing protein [Actinidia rufa]
MILSAMEEFRGPLFDGMRGAIRKKRSQTIRRPRNELLPFPESRDWSPLSSTAPSDDSRSNSSLKIKEDQSSILSYDGGDFEDNADQEGTALNHGCVIEGFLTPANWKSTSKMKRSLELQPRNVDIHGGRTGKSQSCGNSRVNGDGVEIDKVKKIRKVVGRIFLEAILVVGRKESSMGKRPEKNASGNQGQNSEPVRKSKRVPKRRVLDVAFDEDDEIRYLEKLKVSKIASGNKNLEEELSKKQKRISRVLKDSNSDEILEDFVSPRSTHDSKQKSRSERGSVDTDYEEEELVSDGELEGKKRKKLMRESVDSPIESKRELALTTRQRALLSSKDASATGASIVEFPNGLPPAPPRKQKEKLSEVEQQLKKAEAAQRRRMQVEKAARESEAEAIRKILGQDSSRKKREDKMKQRREELEKEKAANALVLPSNTIRSVMSPTGTVITFSKDMGFPSIFDPKPSSYPPPRETCAAPSCTNPYKYRDSKSKLPLCSLQCYKVIHENTVEPNS